MMICVILGFLLSVVIMIVGGLISSSMEVEKESGSVYECGFESSISARVPFSLQFFLIGVIFLIFDVEIALMMPVPLIFDLGLILFVTFSVFVFILLFGLYFEWSEGSLEWIK
uniref:NADH dehydrogenase subunit 3 n=1 Tax=Lychas mucronatus TaxID=172552 RepID=UPI0023D7EF61|nr:NADH dehydrogenase subunit 3 [Lychas mucronatus]WDA95776.1 NADH dehydrogenase subunit 3 [Lychas mucronatus]